MPFLYVCVDVVQPKKKHLSFNIKYSQAHQKFQFYLNKSQIKYRPTSSMVSVNSVIWILPKFPSQTTFSWLSRTSFTLQWTKLYYKATCNWENQNKFWRNFLEIKGHNSAMEYMIKPKFKLDIHLQVFLDRGKNPVICSQVNIS